MDNACLTILTQGRSQAVANGTFIILPHFAEAAETELLLMAFRPLNKCSSMQFGHI
jgi:hypothetical protein